MEGLTEDQLAERAGISADEVRRMVDLGILEAREQDGPFRIGDTNTILLVRSLQEGGVPLESLSQAVSDGLVSFAFADLPWRHQWGGFTGRTYGEVAAELGIPLELAQRLFEAAGLPPPDGDDAVREDDLELLPDIRMLLGTGLDPEALARHIRVYGDGLRRVADSQAGFIHSSLEMPLLASGMSQAEMRDVASDIALQLQPVGERLLTWLYYRHQEHAFLQHYVEDIEVALEEAGLSARREARPPAMCFLDLAGYTRLTEESGDAAAADMATRLADLVQGASRQRGGRPVKHLGDGVMFYFPDPSEAVVSALEMAEMTPKADLPPAHVGLEAGPVLIREGDCFGRTVNVASRIAGRAGPGEVLVGESCVAHAPEGVTLRSLGPVELKGLTSPLVLYRASRV